MSYWEMNLRPFVCILEIVSAICGDLFPFHRLFDLKNRGRPFYPIANYIRSNLGIVIAFVPICTSSCWNGDFFVSFETFFFHLESIFDQKAHTAISQTLHTIKTEWSQSRSLEAWWSTEFSQQSNWWSALKTLQMCVSSNRWRQNLNEGIWVSFETFFSCGINIRPKGTNGNFTHTHCI